ncbi:hypothetical protein [Paenibacillus sp. DMB5]|uniref:hypothetical protein n=1 Tax=Paenibacillus sp. DMB5 TaxID=1780103 RepID=UPI00076D54AF|nr:hypothetical protein [Paenibacillus sp. DMB5]KUP25637.1 hypothetical protein AWJ19_20560 [Paenibacillus sp. DMB5]
MDTKRWSFKVPGQEGSGKAVDISRITSVNDLLAIIRGEEDVQQSSPSPERRPPTAPLPFSRRLGSKGRRRHPSA